MWQPQRNVGISPVVVYSDNITDENTIKGCKYGCCDVEVKLLWQQIPSGISYVCSMILHPIIPM